MINDDYIAAVNAAYWAEEAEYIAGNHPTQVKERIERFFLDNEDEFRGVKTSPITFLDWDKDGPIVEVHIANKPFGIFDYEKNLFDEIYK